MKVNVKMLKSMLLIKFPFFQKLVDKIDIVYEKSGIVASADNDTIYYNDEFRRYNFYNQLFIISHEFFHIAFDHIRRGKGKDALLWNIATDVVINARLVSSGMSMVEGGCYYKDAINYNADSMYEKFLKDGLPEELMNNKNNDKKDFGCYGNPSESNEIAKSFVSLGESKAFDENKKLKGKIMNGFHKDLVDNMLESKVDIKVTDSTNYVDWRGLLEDYLSDLMDWTYQGATIENGVLVPRFVDIHEKQVEVVIDISGSVSPELLKNFLREVLGILDYGKISVGFFNTKFYGFNELCSEEDINNLDFVVGGGTNFLVAMEAFSKEDTSKVIFTDGEAIVPDIKMDVLWVVYGKKDFEPNPGGKSVFVNVDELINKAVR